MNSTGDTFADVVARAASGAELGDGAKSDAFEADYLDPTNCLDAAFADGAEILINDTTGEQWLELQKALAGYQVARRGGRTELIVEQARIVAGLLLTHAETLGVAALERAADKAWEAASTDHAWNERLGGRAA